MGFALLPAAAWGWAFGRLGRGRGMDAKKPQVGKTDIAVTTLERLLTKLRPVVIVGTVLVICLAVYAMAWILTKR